MVIVTKFSSITIHVKLFLCYYCKHYTSVYLYSITDSKKVILIANKYGVSKPLNQNQRHQNQNRIRRDIAAFLSLVQFHSISSES